MADAKACGWGVIIKEALANGRLTDRGATEQVTAVKQQAEALGTTSDALALAAVLSQPWVDVVLSGAVTLEQLDSNLNAVSLAAHVSEWPAIAESPAEYWAARSRLAWN